MGPLTIGSVVLVRFPFSDLSQTKLRPALVLADCDRGDWLLCQITSNPYGDNRAQSLSDPDFKNGSLHVASYARPVKLFTAHHSLVSAKVGELHPASLKRVINAVIGLLQPSFA